VLSGASREFASAVNEEQGRANPGAAPDQRGI